VSAARCRGQPGSKTRAQRYLHLATLLPPWHGYSRALPLRFVPAFPPQAVPGAAEPCKEWEAGLAQLTWLRDERDAAGRREQPLVMLGDGSFEGVDLWKRLPERVSVRARTARNRGLYHLPPPGAHRNRRYGERAPTPQDWLALRKGWHKTTITVRGRAIPLTYRVEGPYVREGAPHRPLFLLVVRGLAQAQRPRAAGVSPPSTWSTPANRRMGRGRCRCQPPRCWPGPGRVGKWRCVTVR